MKCALLHAAALQYVLCVNPTLLLDKIERVLYTVRDIKQRGVAHPVGRLVWERVGRL